MIHDLHKLDRSASDAGLVLHSERPLLIVVEGIDLSGRTTQVKLLHDWLVLQHYAVTTTAWRTSPIVSDLLAHARASRSPLQPMAYSLLFCADHLDRTQHVIKPALARREIVLADRYSYTAFARDAARGVDPGWVRDLYKFAVIPDLVFYLHISPAEAVKRRLALLEKQQSHAHASHSAKAKHEKSTREKEKKKHSPKAEKVSEKDRKQAKKHAQPASLIAVEASAIQTSEAPVLPVPQETLENFRSFEDRMYIEYQRMQKEFGFMVIEGDQPIEIVQARLRRTVMRLLLDL